MPNHDARNPDEILHRIEMASQQLRALETTLLDRADAAKRTDAPKRAKLLDKHADNVRSMQKNLGVIYRANGGQRT